MSKVFIGVLVFFCFSYFVLKPSLNLGLTGDDYLGLWRLNNSIQNSPHTFSTYFAYFFNDYGPQDIFTFVIHSFVGFDPKYYYIISLFLRLLAAASIGFFLFSVTRNQFISFCSAIFFAVSTTGLETTDWSFNMPSYLGIFSMMFFLYFFIQKKMRFFLLSGILFIFTIIIQPIRFIFLPVFVFLLQLFLLFINLPTISLWKKIFRFPLFILIFLIIISVTNIGGMVGGRGVNAVTQNYGSIIKVFEQKNLKILLSPIRQIGAIFVPDTLISPRRIFVPIFSVYVLFAVVIKKVLRFDIKWIFLSVICFGLWELFIWKSFVFGAQYPLQTFEIFGYLTGMMVSIVFILFITAKHICQSVKFGLVCGYLLVLLGFIVPWFRNPGFIYESTGRYLIVSSVGMVIFSASLFHHFYKFSSKFSLVLFFIFISVHARASFDYLNNLLAYREAKTTIVLQHQIPDVPEFHSTEYTLFYFEGDPKILHHVFLFGFPVVMSFQYNFTDFSRIAYTNNWNEVVSAATDGLSMKRFFGGKAVIVPLKNIYAFRVSGNNLENITNQKLESLKIIPR